MSVTYNTIRRRRRSQRHTLDALNDPCGTRPDDPQGVASDPYIASEKFLDVYRCAGRRGMSDVCRGRHVARPLRLKGGHLGLVTKSQSDVVQSLQQAPAGV